MEKRKRGNRSSIKTAIFAVLIAVAASAGAGECTGVVFAEEKAGQRAADAYSLLPGCVHVDGLSDDTVITVAEYWNRIPYAVRTAFYSDGWDLYLLEGEDAIENRFGYDFSVCGITVIESKAIYVETGEKKIRRALIHEAGHFWDWYCGGISETESWIDAYFSDRYTFDEQEKIDNHCISSPVEFYAEIFAQGILHQDTCAASAPNAYHLIFA